MMKNDFRRFLFYLCVYLSIAILTLSACTDLDDINTRLELLEKRLEELAESAEKANTTIAAIEKLLNEMENNKAISNVFKTEDGYLLTLTDGTSIRIQNSETPEFSVGYDEISGLYYWKINGEWLVDEEGALIPASGKNGSDGEDAPTPLLHIGAGLTGADKQGQAFISDAWYLSVDNGVSWARVSNSNLIYSIADIELKGNNLVISFSDGNTVTFPFVSDFQFSLSVFSAGFDYGEEREIEIIQKNVYQTLVTRPEGWKATIRGDVLRVIAPDRDHPYAEQEGEISIVAVSSTGFATIFTLYVGIDEDTEE